MARHAIIPPIGTKGLFVLEPPFSNIIKPGELYEMAAVRYFEDIDKLGQSVYGLFYKPYDLGQEIVDRDRQNKEVIITLLTANYPPIYVPSSYVRTFPNLVSKPYNQVILTLSCGPLPDDVILDPVMNAIAQATSDFLGVTPEVHVGVMALSEAVSPEEDASREAARQGRIANRETDYARLVEEQNKNAILSQRIAICEQILKDNGLLP